LRDLLWVGLDVRKGTNDVLDVKVVELTGEPGKKEDAVRRQHPSASISTRFLESPIRLRIAGIYAQVDGASDAARIQIELVVG
jgi:hypothetical protein